MLESLETRRLLVTWGPDPAYGDAGAIDLPAGGTLIRLGDGASVVISGSRIARYTAAGLDYSFGGDGAIDLPGDGTHGPLAAAAAKGRIVLAMMTDARQLAVARLRPDGRTDRAFAAKPLAVPGTLSKPVGLAVDADQRVYAAFAIEDASNKAVDTRVYRFDSDGSRDLTYGGRHGYATVATSKDGTFRPVEIQPDAGRTGAVFALLAACNRAAVYKLTPTGSPDAAFRTVAFDAIGDGEYGSGRVTQLRIDASDRPLIGAHNYDDYPMMSVNRLTAAGLADASFGRDGYAGLQTTINYGNESPVDDEILDLESAPDGSVYVANRSGLYRFTSAGVPDMSVGEDGLMNNVDGAPFYAGGQAAKLSTLRAFPDVAQIEIDPAGGLMGLGEVDGQYLLGETTTYDRLVRLAPRRDVQLARRVLHVSGGVGRDVIAVTATDTKVTLVRNGVTSTYDRSRVKRVEIDLRPDVFSTKALINQVSVTGLPALVFGGDRPDRIITTAPSVVVCDSRDTVRTGDGDDVVYPLNSGAGSADAISVATGPGNDTVIAAMYYAGLGTLNLGDGDDTLVLDREELGFDDLPGGTVLLGDGDDTATINLTHAVVDGGSGDDRITVYASDNAVRGAGGNDRIENYGSRNNLSGGDGDDVIRNDGWNITAEGGAGNDRFAFTSNAIRSTVSGGLGDDDLTTYHPIVRRSVERVTYLSLRS